jgi:hypothetical protein
MVRKHGYISFNVWIIQFRKEKSDRGILARYFLGYQSGYSINSKDEHVKRLIKNGGSEFLVETFELMWLEFEKLPNAKISIAPTTGIGRTYRPRRIE